MTNKTLVVNLIYKDGNGSADDWLTLEQESISEIGQTLSYADIVAMWYLVISGSSAWTYKREDCPIEEVGDGIFEVELDFYVWPSRLDLNYSLTPYLGSVSEAEYVELEKSFDVTFEFNDEVEFNYIMQDVSVEFQTDAYNKFGEVINKPTLTIYDDRIKADGDFFGVVRVHGVAVGYKHTSIMTLVKYTETENEETGETNFTGYSITNLDNSITASFIDEDGDEQNEVLELDIPSCVEDFLEICDDGSLKGETPTIDMDGECRKAIVKYCTCDGSFISIRYVNC